MARLDLEVYIRSLAEVIEKGSMMLLSGRCSATEYWKFLEDKIGIARATVATSREWAEAIPSEGETPADYARLQSLDPDEAPEEFDI